MGSLAATREELVEALAATGLRVVTDVRNINPPCVLVGVPFAIEAAALDWCNVAMQYPVSVVAPPPGNDDAIAWLLDHLPAVMKAVSGTTADPTIIDVGDVQLPAYTTNVPVRAKGEF